MSAQRPRKELLAEITDLRHRLADAEDTLRAITSGEVDALVVNTELGEKVFTLQGADTVYRIAIENINEGVVAMSSKGAILYSNQYFAQMMQTDLERVIGASVFDFADPEDHKLLANLLEQDAGRGEVSLLSRPGFAVPAYIATTRLQLDSLSICAVVTDLTMQQRSEEIIRTGRLVQSILKQAPNAVIVCDATGAITHASEMAHQLFGHNLIGQPIDGVLATIRISGKPLKLADMRSEDVKTGKTVCTKEDGERVYLLPRYRKLGTGSMATGYVITLTDVTDIRKSGEALRLAKEQLDAAFLNSPVTAFGQDTDLRYTWLYNPNPALAGEPYVGRTDEEILGPQAEPLVKIKRKVIETGKGIRTLFELFGGDREYYYDTSIEPVRDESGKVTGIVCTAIDVTERKRLEDRLAAQERLAYLGRMAGTIAHEVRNPLGTVDTSAFYLEKTLKDADPKTKEHLRRMRNGVTRAANIIEKLLEMSRMKEPELRPVDLSRLVSDTLSDIQVPAAIRVIADHDQEIRIMADEEQLRMAIGNLLRNAIEAMPAGGTLSIHVRTTDSHAEVSVQDTGAGVPPENLRRIFGPLFTTKPGGVGFGLALARTVVERHGGKIEAKPETGKGATFIIRLPLHHRGQAG